MNSQPHNPHNLDPHKKSFFSKLPSIAWVILIPLMIAAFIGAIMGGFWLIASVEGVASVLLLVIAFFVIRAGGNEKTDSFTVAIGIAFFALMGMSVDQPGNFIYNKPIEMIVCQAGSHFNRNIEVSNPLPGTTYIIQNFDCYDDSGAKTSQTSMWAIIIGRFIEYVLIGYALIYLNKAIYRFSKKPLP